MKKIIYALAATIFLLSACKDMEELVKAEDQLIAISYVDIKFPFKDVTTFSVNDTVRELQIDAFGKVTETKTLATYQKDLIIKQMKDRGFVYIPLQEISSTNHSDLFIDLTYVENKYVQAYGFGWWYDYYDPYWYNYWNYDPFYPYYPYYPISYTYVTSYTAKSLIMDCLFLKESAENKHNASSCFMGIVRGVADKYTESQISQYIDQCFEQAPELNRK